VKITGKLEGLVIPAVKPLESPHGRAGEVSRRLQDSVPPDVGQLVLTLRRRIARSKRAAVRVLRVLGNELSRKLPVARV